MHLYFKKKFIFLITLECNWASWGHNFLKGLPVSLTCRPPWTPLFDLETVEVLEGPRGGRVHMGRGFAFLQRCVCEQTLSMSVDRLLLEPCWRGRRKLVPSLSPATMGTMEEETAI